jgi:DNA polymerase-1
MLVVLPYPALKQKAILEHYIEPFGLNPKEVLFVGFETGGKKTIPAAQLKQIISDIEGCVDMFNINTVYVAESAIFKKLVGVTKSTEYIAIPCKPKSKDKDYNIVYGINYQRLFYEPPLQADLTRSYNVAIALSEGRELEIIPPDLAAKVISLKDYFEMKAIMKALLSEPSLALDIEGFSLKFYETGIATFTLAPSTELAYVFDCDMYEEDGENHKEPCWTVRHLLRDFLKEYTGSVRYHNMSFDAKVLIYTLFMNEDLNNLEGLLEGLEVLTKNFDDTKIITYLATNSTSGNELGLKRQSQEFAGNYGIGNDIKNVLKVKLDNLRTYNGIDGLATNFVYEKHWPTLIADNQLEIYNTIFKPSIKLFLQAELTGIPISMEHVYEAEAQLLAAKKTQTDIIFANPMVQQLIPMLQQSKTDAHNAKLKTKVVDISLYEHITYNTGSDTQTSMLLFDIAGLEYEDTTPTGKPSVSKDSLIKIKALNPNAGAILDVVNALIELSEIDILLTNFIEAFKTYSFERKGMGHFLFGSFNLGGTVSGRLSSSKPNLQNIPSSGNKWAKVIKDCFRPPKGWLFVGADFSSLEDRISALTTKDPEKLKIYTDGYDGHCIRAYKYFGHLMEGIDPNSVDSINSIADRYKQFRQDSKAPTFLLTYDGTWHGLVHNCGFTSTQAKEIEAAYHDLYVVSDQWKEARIKQASKDGYAIVAFGLKVRTPVLGQSLMGSKKTPYEAKAEARTVGNAMGQSYGMLNNRAGIEVQEKTLASEFVMDIWPCCHIHDAQYFLVRNKIEPIHFLNETLIPAMEWQELDEIKHPQVKLGGELSVFFPSWKDEVKLPNKATKEEIVSIAKEASKK